jgi:hypothetical protein
MVLGSHELVKINIIKIKEIVKINNKLIKFNNNI